jgi:hypothetical protein
MDCYQPGRVCVFPNPEGEPGSLTERLSTGDVEADYDGVETMFTDVLDANLGDLEGHEAFPYPEFRDRSAALPMRDFSVLRVREGREHEASEQFARIDGVGFASPDYLLATTGGLTDRLQDLKQLIALVPHPAAPFCGRGVRVAIMDSGVDPAVLAQLNGHPGWSDPLEVSLDAFASASSIPRKGDDSGHGTAVAAIVNATAPSAALVSIRVFSHGSGTLSSLVNGLLLLASVPDVAIANLSLSGTPGNCGECGRTSKTGVEIALATLFTAAFRGDPPLVLAAAGNLEGTRPLAFPASCPTVIAIGSYEAATNGTTYTGIDPNHFYLANDFSTTQTRFKGTSFACALTTAIAARYACALQPGAACARAAAKGPRGSSRSYLENRLSKTADRSYAAYDSVHHGQGRASFRG